MAEGTNRKIVAERLAEVQVGDDRTYHLVRFRNGDYGVTRNGIPLVHCDYEVDAKEMFDLVTRPTEVLAAPAPMPPAAPSTQSASPKRPRKRPKMK